MQSIGLPPIIYNLFPRLAGPFSTWVSHLERAAGMGFNWIFINPIQQPGASGSLYATRDHYAIDSRYPEPGSALSPEEQFQSVLEHAHRLGLNVMLDLVINHTASDSVLVPKHPGWYEHDADGALVHPSAPDTGQVWRDLATIDNDNAPDKDALWQYWEDLVIYYLRLGLDGFRCDAAYQVPSPLWQRIIDRARKLNPKAAFFAETLGCDFKLVIELGRAGFDFIFNSSKWWDFKAPWLLPQYEENRLDGKPSISFPDSHDTARVAAETDGNVNAIKLRYLFAAVFSTGVMMVAGYEFCFRKQLHVVFTRPEDWEPDGCNLTRFIRAANALKTHYRVFGEESRMEFIATANPRVFAMRKTSADDNQRALVILNTDYRNAQHTRVVSIRELLGNPQLTKDISLENPLGDVPEVLDTVLRPGQSIILYGER